MTNVRTSQNSPAKRSRKSSRRSFGAIRQERSGRYQASYLDQNGIRHSAPTTFTTKTAADNWLTTERADILRGTYRAPDLGAVALTDYLTEWLAHRTDLSPVTRNMYETLSARWLFRDLALPTVGNRKQRTVNLGSRNLNTLTVGMIREWYAAAHHTQQVEAAARAVTGTSWKERRQHPARIWARSQGHTVNDKGRLSPVILKAWKRTGSPILTPEPEPINPHAKPAVPITQAYRCLRACLNAAVRDGLIVANPCQIPNAGVSKSAERIPATPAQVNVIADAMPTRYAAAVHAAAYTGLRAGELFGLSRAHVDLDAGTVRVDRAMQQVGSGKPYLGPTKTDSSRRTVYMPPHVVKIIRAHMDAYTAPGPDALIFCREDGRLLPSNRRQQLFAKARLAANRPDLRWHDLRHTGATLASEAGASLREVQNRLGHSTVVAAMRYQHASPARDQEIARRLSEIAAAPLMVHSSRTA